MNQTEWLAYGRENEWITSSFDYYDDGPELTDAEMALVEDGDLPEVWCFRYYEEAKEQK